ncbi:MAG: hypothetical protein KAT65_18080 [Methanophagales archaeon]|nr:hypothetical protein [Methanophagales archaeon]
MTKVFQLQPKVGQHASGTHKGDPVSGSVVSISNRGIEIQTIQGNIVLLDSGSVSYRFNFATFDDTVYHLSLCERITHCDRCYFAFLYGVDLLSSPFNTELFSGRADQIRRGLVSFISRDFASAAYMLFPQIDGIVIGKLHREGLLRETQGFPKWTKEHPDSKLHGQPCKNLEEAFKGAESAGDRSALSQIVKWCEIEPLRNLRNKLMHGQMLEISEHETANIVILLHAVFHHIELNQPV